MRFLLGQSKAGERTVLLSIKWGSIPAIAVGAEGSPADYISLIDTENVSYTFKVKWVQISWFQVQDNQEIPINIPLDQENKHIQSIHNSHPKSKPNVVVIYPHQTQKIPVSKHQGHQFRQGTQKTPQVSSYVITITLIDKH